jgi:hypothetical protein
MNLRDLQARLGLRDSSELFRVIILPVSKKLYKYIYFYKYRIIGIFFILRVGMVMLN